MRLDEQIGKEIVGIGEDFEPMEANTEIWIADNVQIACTANYRWWHRFFVKLLFGWKVFKIKETIPLKMDDQSKDEQDNREIIFSSNKVGIETCLPDIDYSSNEVPSTKLEIKDSRDELLFYVHEVNYKKYLTNELTFEGLLETAVTFPMKGRRISIKIEKYTPTNLEVTNKESEAKDGKRINKN